jgi:hypothetical protein
VSNSYVDRMVAEAERLLAAPELETERQDAESPETFVMRKALEASGLLEEVAALRCLLREWIEWSEEGNHTVPAETYFKAREVIRREPD